MDRRDVDRRNTIWLLNRMDGDDRRPFSTFYRSCEGKGQEELAQALYDNASPDKIRKINDDWAADLLNEDDRNSCFLRGIAFNNPRIPALKAILSKDWYKKNINSEIKKFFFSTQGKGLRWEKLKRGDSSFREDVESLGSNPETCVDWLKHWYDKYSHTKDSGKMLKEIHSIFGPSNMLIAILTISNSRGRDAIEKILPTLLLGGEELKSLLFLYLGSIEKVLGDSYIDFLMFYLLKTGKFESLPLLNIKLDSFGGFARIVYGVLNRKVGRLTEKERHQILKNLDAFMRKEYGDDRYFLYLSRLYLNDARYHLFNEFSSSAATFSDFITKTGARVKFRDFLDTCELLYRITGDGSYQKEKYMAEMIKLFARGREPHPDLSGILFLSNKLLNSPYEQQVIRQYIPAAKLLVEGRAGLEDFDRALNWLLDSQPTLDQVGAAQELFKKGVSSDDAARVFRGELSLEAALQRNPDAIPSAPPVENLANKNIQTDLSDVVPSAPEEDLVDNIIQPADMTDDALTRLNDTRFTEEQKEKLIENKFYQNSKFWREVVCRIDIKGDFEDIKTSDLVDAVRLMESHGIAFKAALPLVQLDPSLKSNIILSCSPHQIKEFMTLHDNHFEAFEKLTQWFDPVKEQASWDQLKSLSSEQMQKIYVDSVEKAGNTGMGATFLNILFTIFSLGRFSAPTAQVLAKRALETQISNKPIDKQMGVSDFQPNIIQRDLKVDNQIVDIKEEISLKTDETDEIEQPKPGN